MKHEKIIGRPTIGFYFFLLLIVGAGMCGMSYYLISTALKGPYFEIVPLSIGCFFGICGFLCIYSILTLDALEIYNNTLTIKSIFCYTRKVIDLHDIVTWTEIEKESKYHTWTDLTIYTNKGKYNISSTLYGNYKLIKAALTKGKEKVLTLTSAWFRQNARFKGILYLLAASFLIFFSIRNYLSNNEELRSSDITLIKQVITSPIGVHEDKEGVSSVRMKVKDYPDFEFKIEDAAYYAFSINNFLRDVKINDTLTIGIKTEDYQKKLTKEQPLEFSDKTIDYKYIDVYSLKDDKNNYLSFADYREREKPDGHLEGLVLGIIGFVLLLPAGCYFLEEY